MKKEILLSLAIITILIFPAISLAETTLKIVPNQQTSIPGKSVSFVVRADNITGLFGFQFSVSYDNDIIQYYSISNGSFMGNNVYCFPPSTSSGHINNYACTLLGNLPGVSGSGDIAVITFNSTSAGNTPITFNNVKLSDNMSTEIGPIVLQGGKITVIPCVDNDNDGYYASYCGGNDCDDSDSSINPGAEEICNDALNADENCDGRICTSTTLVVTNYYDGNTTNFSDIDLSNIQNLVLEKLGAGKIVFREPVSFAMSVNLDSQSNISYNRVFINSSAYPMLNRSATIYLYGITLNNPLILMDGNPCPSSVCSLVSYEDNTFVFDVMHFTTYSLEGRCSDGTLYGQCSSNKPYYCDNGTLIKKASSCGCSAGQTVSGDECVEEQSNSGSGQGSGGGPVISQCTNGETRQCGETDVGACSYGTQTCENGAWGDCVGQITPNAEVCNNGIDDDCDGQTDESDCVQCEEGATRNCGKNIGICKYGTSTCTNGVWGECVGGVKANEYDICGNNLDDDCNGLVDDACESAQESCSNGIQDSNEEGIDCGGVCPNPCPEQAPIQIGTILIIIGIVLIVIALLYTFDAFDFLKSGATETASGTTF